MLYTLSFSTITDNHRVPLRDEQGRDVTLQVEAESKSAAIYHPETVQFCQERSASVRRVL